MKTKSLLFILMLTGILNAQITLENSYNATTIYGNFSVINLSSSGYKYCYANYANKTVKLYNLNHSIWKTINLPVPNGYSVYSVYNVSESLFNTDASIEVAYTSFLYNFTVTPAIWNYEGKVVNETGTSLVTIPDCQSLSVSNTGPNGWKLIATIDSTNKSSIKSFDVYSLVGSLPLITAIHNETPVDMGSSLTPNPSGDRVRIDYNLPPGVTSGEITLFDLNGSELKRYAVDNSFTSLDLNNGDLPSGTYFYKISAGNNSTTKKMIIVK